MGRQLRDSRGASIVEVMVTSLVLSIALVGAAVMFSTGGSWVMAQGDDRISLALAQQKIEQLRSQGFASVPVGYPANTARYNEGTLWYDKDGFQTAAPTDPARGFIRLTCVQYVNETDFSTLAYPASGNRWDPSATTCPNNPPTGAKRITVIVGRRTGGVTNVARFADDGVIFQAWINNVPGGL